MAKIFINPGHGGSDPGACGNGLKERDVVLKIGKRVEGYLQAVGFVTKLFQYNGLHEICNESNAWGADLFVSIHCNAGGGTGSETFYYYGSTQGRKLAEAIQKQVVNSIGTVNRRVEAKGFAVLSGTVAPAALVETAFIDNARDARLLVEKEDDFARAIARGITDYCSIDKPLPDVIDTPKQTDESVCPYCGHALK